MDIKIITIKKSKGSGNPGYSKIKDFWHLMKSEIFKRFPRPQIRFEVVKYDE
jgi:hypothetical protein